MFTKKDIQKANERFNLIRASRDIGKEVKSLKDVTFERETKFKPLGKTLQNIYNKRFKR